MDELVIRPNTRQAVISIFWPEDVKQMGGKQRIPCSMYYQFLLRGYDLHVIYTMRSCDYFNHFKVDAYLAWSVGEKIARHLSGTFRELVQVKSLTHFIGSLHCFKKDLDVAGIF